MHYKSGCQNEQRRNCVSKVMQENGLDIYVFLVAIAVIVVDLIDK